LVLKEFVSAFPESYLHRIASTPGFVMRAALAQCEAK
jgi:hypothetical protein